jgi:hypothetical protein
MAFPRPKYRSIALLLPLLAACSASEEQVSPPVDDTGAAADTSVAVDSGAVDSSADPDTGTAADTGVTADSGMASDTTVMDSGAADTAVADTAMADSAKADSAVPTDTAIVVDAPPAPTCMDLAKNGTETDVDCGGATCGKCADTKTCLSPTDCVSGACTSGKCAAASCTDAVKNGSETDVDCGGATCGKCANDKACSGGGDCLSGSCSGGKCVAASCTDGAKNGTEVDVDCGGATCPACGEGKDCTVPGDCASSTCTAGKCIASCTDKVKNGSETAVDCGGACTPCPVASGCLVDQDCLGTYCASTTKVCTYAESCNQLHLIRPTLTTGSYMIDPDGTGPLSPLMVHCDMTTGGGGWTLFYSSSGTSFPLSSGTVGPASNKYMPFAALQAIANKSSQIYVETPGSAATKSMTSVPGALPIVNLRNGNFLNKDSPLDETSDSPAAYWTGPRAVNSQYLWHQCWVPPYGSSVGTYPDLFWACGNGGGLHVAAGNSQWVWTVNEAMSFYVR